MCELGLRDSGHGRGRHSRLRELFGQRLSSEGAWVQFDEPEDEERSQGHQAVPLVAEPALGSPTEIWHPRGSPRGPQISGLLRTCCQSEGTSSTAVQLGGGEKEVRATG